MHNAECFANHMGLWLCEPHWMSEAVAAVRSGSWQAITADKRERMTEKAPPVPAYGHIGAVDFVQVAGAGGTGYFRHESGIGVVNLSGPMMKGRSKYGGASTLDVRRVLRAADTDLKVSAILLAIDSPGGHTAGTQELGDTVRGASKPVAAHIDDLGASAAYWIASQASDGISVNRSGEVGSIGTVAVVYDSSGKAEQEGVAVHVVSTGAYKGAFAPGAEITREHLAYLQERVDSINAHFLQAVADGRGMDLEKVREAADGRVFSADTGLTMGLVDRIESMDQALASLNAKYGIRRTPANASRRKRMEAQIAIAQKDC